MSATLTYRGRGLAPGGQAYLACEDLDRATVELLLASWFAWLGDGAKITIAPAGIKVSAELRVRRSTRRSVAIFRWRNADETREFFAYVQDGFEANPTPLETEQTANAQEPWGMVTPLDADDVFSPAGAVGLANRAFAAADVHGCTRYDLTCAGPVLRQSTRPVAMFPRQRASHTALTRALVLPFALALAVRHGIRWIRRAVGGRRD